MRPMLFWGVRLDWRVAVDSWFDNVEARPLYALLPAEPTNWIPHVPTGAAFAVARCYGMASIAMSAAQAVQARYATMRPDHPEAAHIRGEYKLLLQKFRAAEATERRHRELVSCAPTSEAS